MSTKSELDKSVVMAWVDFSESIFRIPVPAKGSCHVSEKNMADAVARDMASSDWLKLANVCLFPAQKVSKNKSICDCAGARPQSD